MLIISMLSYVEILFSTAYTSLTKDKLYIPASFFAIILIFNLVGVNMKP